MPIQARVEHTHSSDGRLTNISMSVTYGDAIANVHLSFDPPVPDGEEQNAAIVREIAKLGNALGRLAADTRGIIVLPGR